MSSTFRLWKNRLQCSNKHNVQQNQSSVDGQIKNVEQTIELLLSDNSFLKARLEQLEASHQRWINDEQTNLLRRVEQLENENQQLHELYLSYQIQNESCMRSITDLIMKILLTQEEQRREHNQECHENDVAHGRKKQQQDDNRCTTNDRTTWFDQRLMNVDEHERPTANHSSELDKQLITLAAVKSKSEKSSAGLTNRLYYLLSSDKSPRDNHRLPNVNIVSVDGPNAAPRKQHSSLPANKNRPTRTAYSNHERPVIQVPSRPVATGKTTPATVVSKPVRVSTTTVRPAPTTNTRPRLAVPSTTTQKAASSTSLPNKPSRPRYTLAKSSEPLRTVSSVTATPTTTVTTTVRPASRSTITSKPSNAVTKPTTTSSKPRSTPVVHQPTRVSDLDALPVEQPNSSKAKKPVVVAPRASTIRQSLFTKNTVKLVRPVRSQELKTFACHLAPEVPPPTATFITSQTKESLSTLTPPSLESITENKPTEQQQLKDQSDASSHLTSIVREFSEDSLNEQHHIQKLRGKDASLDTPKNNKDARDPSSGSDLSPLTLIKAETSADSAYCNGSMEQENERTSPSQSYFLVPDDHLAPQSNQSSSKAPSPKSVVHRLVFPARLGRMIFFRRILSDLDIYQKICSKDAEITHNVYHLDTIRDYSMEFYMLTTYASDSQLRAWIDCSDDELVHNVCHFDDSQFQIGDYEEDKQMNRTGSSSSLVEQELDWYSELEVLNLSVNNPQDKHETTSSCSSKVHVEELLHTDMFSLSSPTTTTSVDSASSAGLTPPSWSIRQDPAYHLHSTPISSAHANLDNSILQEILNHSWTDHLPPPTSVPETVLGDQCENDLTSSIITDEFQSDFYYLCPVTNTTTFARNDPKTLFHDV